MRGRAGKNIMAVAAHKIPASTPVSPKLTSYYFLHHCGDRTVILYLKLTRAADIAEQLTE